MSARDKRSEPGQGVRTFQAPAGYRESPEPVLTAGEVVASQYTARREVARVETGALHEAWDMLLERTILLKVGWRDAGTPSLLPEARRCSSVACDAAAAVYAVGQHRGLEFIAGERLVTTPLREHLRGYAAAGARMSADDVLALFLRVARALEMIHGAGFTVGDLSIETLALRGQHRVVFGRFSLGQIPAIGPTGVCLAPEVLIGRANPSDPAAAVAIDLYGLGVLGLEIALARPPFTGDDAQALMQAHAHQPAPSADARSDLPAELTDLLAELASKDPAERPATAASVVAQLEIIGERAAAGRRVVRVLVVDDDGDRVRAIWSAARRAHPRSQVDAARDGREAAAKLTRDRPDVVLIDAALGAGQTGGMNALELVMFARGLEEAVHAAIVVIGGVNPRDTAVFAQFGARLVGTPARLGDLVADVVRAAAATPRLGAARRTQVMG